MRTFRLTVRNDGTIVLHYPHGCSRQDAFRFLEEKKDWVLKQEQAVSVRGQSDREDQSSDVIYWLGEAKHVRTETAVRSHCRLEGDTIVFALRDPEDTAAGEAAFRRLAARKLMELLNEERPVWDREICAANGFPYPEIRLRWMRSEWGSCAYGRGRITMNLRLIHYPPVCLHYVLLHEYTHFLVHGHGPAFWREVAGRMADYRDAEKILKEGVQDGKYL